MKYRVGTANRRSSAVFVTAYLNDRFWIKFGKEAFKYEEDKPGYDDFKIYHIIVTTDISVPIEVMEACRAFMAARGDFDIWA